MKGKLRQENIEEIKKQYNEIQKILKETEDIEKKEEIRNKLKPLIKRILKLEKKEMSLEELSAYYRELRKISYENQDPVKGIEIRKKLHVLTRQIVKLEKLLSNYSVKILSDERIKTNKPKVYVVTHVARYDIEASIEAIKENAFILWGDVGELYRRPEMLLLKAIGIIPVDVEVKDENNQQEVESIKEDKHISLETMIKVLKQKGNVELFPEGAWNITDNMVVMKLFSGAVEAAIRGEADIIPVAIDKDKNNNYYVKIGKNINTSNMKLEDKKQEAENLRSILAGLKYDIWEEIAKVEGPTMRSEMPSDAREQYINDIMKDSDNNYTIESIEKTRYKEKGVTSPEEAFAHLGRIQVNKNTAFLFKDANEYQRKERAKMLIKNR